MTSISELFPKCRKLAYDARQQLAFIQQSTKSQQTSSSSSASSVRSAVSELYLVLEELNRQLDMMEQLLLRETPAQRQVWKQKISSTRQEAADLQQQAQAADYYYASKQQRNPYYSSHQSDREEVLRHRRRGGVGGAEDDMRNLAQESHSLQQSQSAVMNLISQGQDSLEGLYRQRQQLRGVRRFIVEIDSALGLSQSTMRIIERRDITDAYLVAAGVVVTLIVIYVVWFVF